MQRVLVWRQGGEEGPPEAEEEECADMCELAAMRSIAALRPAS